MRIYLQDLLPRETQEAADLADRSTAIRSQHKYDGVISSPPLPLGWEQGPDAAVLGARGHGTVSPRRAAPDCLPSQSQCKQGLQENTKSFSDVVWKREPSIA